MHSPAPWKIVRTSEYTGDSEDDHKIDHIAAADGTTVLYTDSGYFKPREDDARLIASAPALAQALAAARNYIEDEFDSDEAIPADTARVLAIICDALQCGVKPHQILPPEQE